MRACKPNFFLMFNESQKSAKGTEEKKDQFIIVCEK